MRIINVLEMILGKPNQLISFPVYHEKESEEKVIAEAHKIFGVLVKENDTDITKEKLEKCIKEGVYTQHEYEVHLIWSEI